MLGTAAVGLLCFLIGITLAALGICSFLLYRAASTIREQTISAHESLTRHLDRHSAEIYQLKLELTTGLSKLNASELRDAAVSISRTGKNLASTTAMLYKLVLSQPDAGAVVEDVLRQDVDLDEDGGDGGRGHLSSSRAQAMINEIHQRAGMAPESSPPQQAPMDLEQAWAADESEYR
jgi:hypothetical protein